MWTLKNILLFLICVFLLFLGVPVQIKSKEENLFEKYLQFYNKSYPDERVYMIRLQAFKDSLATISHLNALRTSESSARYGITEFSDLLQEEFVQKHLQKDYMERSKLTKTRRSKRNTKHFQNINKGFSTYDLKFRDKVYKFRDFKRKNGDIQFSKRKHHLRKRDTTREIQNEVADRKQRETFDGNQKDFEENGFRKANIKHKIDRKVDFTGKLIYFKNFETERNEDNLNYFKEVTTNSGDDVDSQKINHYQKIKSIESEKHVNYSKPNHIESSKPISEKLIDTGDKKVNKISSEEVFDNVLYVDNLVDVLKNNDIRKQLNLPTKVDWREKGVVTEVNNQHGCGACWAFSVIEMIESISAINGNVLEKLSTQELIDCARNGNRGCSGGFVCSTLEWLMDENVPLMPESRYPLHLKTERCNLNKSADGGVWIKNYTCDSYMYDEGYLLAVLAYHGPVAVVINAMLWQYYLDGVIHYHCSSGSQHLNHAAQIVGYNLEAEIPHYIVRNSWGTDFGDHGYLYIAIGSNMCGLANEVAFVEV